MNLNNRLSKIENKMNGSKDRITGIDFVIIEDREQADHRERFRKVLQSEQVSETGFTRRIYHLERIE